MAVPHRALTLSVLAFFAGAAANAAEKKLDPVREWNVSGNFKGGDARMNISGAACTTKLKSCLIVNDEENYAQFFDIEGTTLVPGDPVTLREKAEGDPDGEGAAYYNDHFYVTGSHGRARHSVEKSSVPSYVVFRFHKDRPNDVEASTRLHDVIHDSPGIGQFFNDLLDKNGVNIEGIAVKDGRMYLGFRGPSTEGHAFILSVDAAAVFTKKDPVDAKVAKVKLGPTTGIRDLAAVDGGLLILSGPVNDQDVIPAIFLWNDQTGDLKLVGELVIPAKLKEAKAETLLILPDLTIEAYRALIMFDGAENGAPTEYLVPR